MSMGDEDEEEFFVYTLINKIGKSLLMFYCIIIFSLLLNHQTKTLKAVTKATIF